MIQKRPGTRRVSQRVEGNALTAWDRFYLGKKIAYVYRGEKEKRGTKIRVIWGKVTRPHGRQRACYGLLDCF
jgi:ribosomal protein L35AE/L33A